MSEKIKKKVSAIKNAEKPLKKAKEKVKKSVNKTAVIGKPNENFWKNNKGTVIIVGIVVLLVALTLLIEGNEKAKTVIDYSTLGSDIQEWYNDTQENQYVITVIALSTCPWCEKYKPLVAELAEEKELKLYWFEIDTMETNDSDALQNTYNLENYSGSSPYTLLTYNGEFVTDVVGYMEKSEIDSFLVNAGALK